MTSDAAELRVGERVRLRYYRREVCGTVTAVGPCQSEVRLDGERESRVYVNHELARIVQRRRLRRKLRHADTD